MLAYWTAGLARGNPRVMAVVAGLLSEDVFVSFDTEEEGTKPVPGLRSPPM
tara:strand:- start:152 stop:304 length:153 start_codon:yes stop_codon:yes gene_type:complete